MKKLVLALVVMVAVAASGRPLLAQDAPKDDPRLVALGGMSASAMYCMFLVVGMAGDAFVNEKYSAEQTSGICNEMIGLSKTNVKQLKTMMEGAKFTEEDQQFLKETIEVLENIQAYAGHLVEYTKAKEKKHADEFEKTRKETWAKLKKLLGIK